MSNNNFIGSLEPLAGLTKLEWLEINDTDIDSGLEYLPENIERFSCSISSKKSAKVKAVYNLLANEKGEVEIEYEHIKNFPQKLKEYKQFIEYLEINDYTHNKNLDLIELKKEYQEELKKQKTSWEKFQGKEIDNTTLHQRWKQANFSKFSQHQIKLLEEEKEKLVKRIANLEILTTENERLIREQKSKIGENIKDYFPFFEEEDKQIIQKLIETHKTYKEAEKTKQWKEANTLFEKFISTRQQLKEKLGEDFMEMITMILTNFEELYQREWDLQEQTKQLETNRILIKEQTKLIEELKQTQHQLKEITSSYLNEKQEQLKKLLTGRKNNLALIEMAKEEIKILQEELENQEQTPQILHQPFGTPSSSKPK